MFRNHYFQVDTPADLADAIILSDRLGAIGLAHLLRAVAQGRIALFPLLPDTGATQFEAFARATSHRPAVALLGDDDGLNRGPAGWSMAGRATAWARAALVHGAGAEPSHYEMAIQTAKPARRVLIIECGSATLDAWASLVSDAAHRPSALIICPHGGVHPVPGDRGALH